MVVFLLLVSFGVAAIAQTGGAEGRINGTVKDPSGAVVPNATVTIMNQGTGVTSTTTSSSEGAFLVPSLSVALYNVTFEASGFAKRVYQDVKVNAGMATSLTAVLSVGSSNEMVEVKADQETVNTTTSEASKTVNTIQVQNLPLNGRGVIGLLG
ncbi:MAG: carboxypeptidase-like regulatory domain-containing protein, partial [Terriglobales bacterium]